MFATNDIKSQDALEAYHTSWKVENFFRIMKSTLEVKHLSSTGQKIGLKEAQEKASPEEIRESLNFRN